jgi:cell division protein FtsB
MVKDILIASTTAAVTYGITLLAKRRERRTSFQKQMIALYEELSQKHLELQTKYNELYMVNLELNARISRLASEMDSIKQENHTLKRKLSLLQCKSREGYNEKDTTSA